MADNTGGYEPPETRYVIGFVIGKFPTEEEHYVALVAEPTLEAAIDKVSRTVLGDIIRIWGAEMSETGGTYVVRKLVRWQKHSGWVRDYARD